MIGGILETPEFESMCDIVHRHPPKAVAVERVAEQVESCPMPPPQHPVADGVRRVGEAACAIGSEFSIPGTQHLLETGCKIVVNKAVDAFTSDPPSRLAEE